MAEKKTTRRKKTETVKEEPKKAEMPDLDVYYIYHDGDNIQEIAKILTGHSYMMYRMLEYSGLKFGELKDGDMIKWRF